MQMAAESVEECSELVTPVARRRFGVMVFNQKKCLLQLCQLRLRVHFRRRCTQARPTSQLRRGNRSTHRQDGTSYCFLSTGVDFTERIGKPIRRPDEKGEETSNDTSAVPASLGSPATRPDLSLVSGGMDRHNSLCGPGSSFTQMLSPSHVKSRTSSESDKADWEESDDEIAFIESRFGEVDLNPPPGLSSPRTQPLSIALATSV